MIGISNQEAQEILISVVSISVALAIAMGGIGILGHPAEAVVLVSFFLVSVGSGFILHELAHKFTANMFGAYARFRMWTQGLILMFIMAIVAGFIFAAPGAVYIYERLTRRQNGIVSIAGPATNIVLAVLFLALSAAVGGVNFGGLEMDVWGWAARINIFLALFNMIPIYPLDGSKVLAWNPIIYFGFGGLVLLMYMVV